MRRHLHGHVVDSVRPRGRGEGDGTALDGPGALGRPARTAGRPRGRSHGPVRGRVRDLRGGELARAARDARAARARARERSPGSRAHGDDDARPRPGHVRDSRAAARAGPPRVAVVSPLPARRLRRAGAALGPARGRPLRPRRPPLRGDGHRRPARQLPPRGARDRDDPVAPRLHHAPPRRVPEPGDVHGPRVALRRRRRSARSTPASRAGGARRERRSSAAAAACGRRTSRSS